jgi:hypothetical protein
MQDNLTRVLLDKDNPPRTMKEAGERAGYKTIKSRAIYRPSTKKHILEVLSKDMSSKDTLKDYFQALSTLALETKDLTNANRSAENIAKMYQHMKEGTTQAVAVFTNIEADIEKVITTNETPST